MMNKSQNHRSRFGARNTLFIDQNDAAYWLAADNFVEDEENFIVESSSPRKVISKETSMPSPSPSMYPKTLNFSQKRPKNTTHLLPPSTTGHLANTAPSTPSSKAGWAFESEQFFASPRRAPPTPDIVPQEKVKNMATPISPLSPITPATTHANNSLLPPVDISSHSIEKSSPRSSPRFGFDKFVGKKQAGNRVEERVSTQTFSSGSSHLTSIEPSQVGTAIISSFPTPPQREERARMIDFNEIRKRAMGPLGERKEETKLRPISKPLPAPPFSPETEIDSDDDDGDSFDGLYAESENDFEKPSHLPVSNVFHRPLCPYADHSDVSNDHCGCRLMSQAGSYQVQKGNGLASSSAPDLLNMISTDKQEVDMRRAKDVLYRLSNEIRSMEAQQKQQGDQASKKTTIKFALPGSNSFDLSRLNNSLPPSPNKDQSDVIHDKLLPLRPHIPGDRSVSPGPSFGLAAGMLHACLSPNSPSFPIDQVKEVKREEAIPIKSSLPSVRPKRSFDMLRRFRADSPIPANNVTPRKAFTPSPPLGPSRQMISSVRSHDRWNSNGSSSNGSHGAGAQDFQRRVVSPTRRQNMSPYQWDSPWQQIRSQTAKTAEEISRHHHRQTSSKDSSSSSGSTFTSNNGTIDSTTLPSTPLRSILQSKGQPTMRPIIESSKDHYKATSPVSKHTPNNNSNNNNSRTPISFRRPKQDIKYFEKAVEPFPLASNAMDEQRGDGNAPPLPPPLPEGHRLLIDSKNKQANYQTQAKPVSRSNSDHQSTYGFAL